MNTGKLKSRIMEGAEQRIKLESGMGVKTLTVELPEEFEHNEKTCGNRSFPRIRK